MCNSLFEGRGLLSISPADQLVKVLITLEPRRIYLDQVLHTYIFKHCPATGMQNGVKASLDISSAGQGRLGELLISFEPLSICFIKHCIYLYILALSRHRYVKR